LTVRKPDGIEDIIAITRDVVQIEETFVKYTVLEVDGVKFGYINVPSFYRDFEKSRLGEGRNSTQDTRDAIVELRSQGIEGIILDLRNNGGGSLVDAVDITGLFIEEGPVVQVRNSQGLKRVLEDDDDTLVYGGPLVVLVNRFSASASEIVAAALQDYRRAVIVGGQHTHGKGPCRPSSISTRISRCCTCRRYDDLGALKATIQKFYRVDGGSTQYKGVVPDIILPSLFQNLKSGEQYLDYSLKWEQVQPVSLREIFRQGRRPAGPLSRAAGPCRRFRGNAADRSRGGGPAAGQSRQSIELDLDSMRAKRLEEKQARETVGAHFGPVGQRRTRPIRIHR
jgi:carboxyl-terminal processing protease